MRRILRIGRALLGVVVVLVLLAGIGLAGALWLTLPGGDLRADLPGLAAPVEVVIDPDGIPRVRAGSETDVAAALGFLHARERMAQMDLMRRAASGELAALAGPAVLPMDRMTRTLGLRRRAHADLAALPADTRAMLEAYANGVNAWIGLRGRFAAPEFLLTGAPAPWTAVDSLLWGKTMSLWLSGNWRTELARLALAEKLPPASLAALWPGPPLQQQAEASPGLGEAATRLAAVLPAFPAPFTLPQTASNAWAVDAGRSATGAPLLAGDPHLGFGLPGIWYLARLETPTGTLSGATAPGVPFVVIGQNDRIAWSFTTTGADTQDLFIETPAGPESYLTPEGPRPYEVREEHIQVRGGPDEVLSVRETRHGPVISDLVGPTGAVLALAAANLAPGDTAAAGLLALNRARSVADAGAAAAAITSPVQNLMVADRQGIGLFVTGRVPLRRAGDGARPVPGAEGHYDWAGFASGAQLPHQVAPAAGWLANANERIAPADFPVFLGRDWFDDARARRIQALLDQGDTRTQADLAAMQVDTVDLVARDLLPRLRAVAVPDGLPRAALALLAEWDGQTRLNLPQPLIFNAWMRQLNAAILARAGVPAAARAAAAPWTTLVPHALGPGGAALCGGDCSALLPDALAAATAELSAAYGPDPASWHWGTAHEARFEHPILRAFGRLGGMAGARIAAPGDDSTLFRAGMGPGSFDAVHGAGLRGVFDLADPDRSLFMVVPGQSGNPASRLARNFIERWRDGGMVTIRAEPEVVDVRLHLTPGAQP